MAPRAFDHYDSSSQGCIRLLHNIQETVRRNAALSQRGVKDTILFSTEATLSKLGFKSRGPGTCLDAPPPLQMKALALTRDRVSITLAPTPHEESRETIRTL